MTLRGIDLTGTRTRRVAEAASVRDAVLLAQHVHEPDLQRGEAHHRVLGLLPAVGCPKFLVQVHAKRGEHPGAGADGCPEDGGAVQKLLSHARPLAAVACASRALRLDQVLDPSGEHGAQQTQLIMERQPGPLAMLD